MENATSQPIRALIVGDSHITRSGLRRILESQSNMLVLGEIKTGNVNELDVYRGQHLDIALVDLDPHGADALVCIRTIKQYLIGTEVLVIGDLGDDGRTRKALDLGAAGIFFKMQPPSVLIAAIESLCFRPAKDVELGKAEPHVRSVHRLHNRENSQSHNAMNQSLTERERGIITLIAGGLKNKEIAAQLYISDITVRHHLTSIFMKLGVSDRQKLLIHAYQHGLVKLAGNPKHLDPLLPA